MSTLRVVDVLRGYSVTGTAKVHGSMSRDKFVVGAHAVPGGEGGMMYVALVRLTPQEAAEAKRARRALRLDASNYARQNGVKA